MTNEEKLEILADAEVRAYKAIKTWDGPSMASENFLHLLHVVDQLRWMQGLVSNPDQCAEADPFVPPTPISPVEQPDTPAPVKEDKPEQPTMTKAEMVSKLTTFQTNGVAIDKVMESMGYTKLSQVPADLYCGLLDLCQQALDGEG
jgi:hypothetical protein